MLHACQNCWFNGLQYGVLGLPVGYCSRHGVVLNASSVTTCGLHVRKDLPLARAKQVSVVHSQKYSDAIIIHIYENKETEGIISSDDRDFNYLRSDSIGEAVYDYGALNSAIESLSQLKALRGARAEVALNSLARGYVDNCMAHNGQWTSGIHLYWWAKTRLPEIPDIALDDICTTGGISLSKQIELTKWSVMMLRLTFIDDILQYALSQKVYIGGAKGILQKSAEDLNTFNLNRLSKWLGKKAIPLLDSFLPKEKYFELARELHKNT